MPNKEKVYRKYSPEDLKRALEAVKNGSSCASAAKEFNFPRITLMYKLSGKVPLDCRSGVGTILTVDEENLLTNWIISVAKTGFPVTKDQLLDSVAMLVKKLKRPNNFTNGRPGRHWFEGFLQRHPEISQRMTQNLTSSRAAVSEINIRKWFDEINDYFVSNKIEINSARQMFNTDETAFFLTPKGNKVLTKRGSKTVYSYSNANDKECITTLITGNAAGELAPPMIMYSYERVPKTIILKCPHPDWAIGRSDTGWMTAESFFEYITNNFYKWLLGNKIPFPVVLFVDGHKSHLTYNLSSFCSEKNIILISLLPNSTHILQPMDVGVFHPLKSNWRKEIHNWKLENKKQNLKKEDFAPLLSKVLQETLKNGQNKILPNAFRKCGLYPFDVNGVDFSKLLKTELPTSASNVQIAEPLKSKKDFKDAIGLIESFIEKDLLHQFQENVKSSGSEWKGKVEDTSLFFLWKKINEKQQEGENNQQTDGDIIIEIGDDVVVEDINWENVTIDLNEQEETIINESGMKQGDEVLDIEIENANETSEDNFLIRDSNENCEVQPENEYSTENQKTSEQKVNSTDKETECDVVVNDLEYAEPIGNEKCSDQENIKEQESKDADKQDEVYTLKEDDVLDLEKKDSGSDKNLPSPDQNEKFVSNNNNIHEMNNLANNINFSKKVNANVSTAEYVNDTEDNKNIKSDSPLIPSPFKSILFWPEVSTTKKLTRVREKIPSVCSSEKWKEYYLKKENAKNEKEKAIQERKRKREEKKEQKKENKETKACKKLRSTCAVEDAKKNIFSENNNTDTSSAIVEKSNELSQPNINLNDYVIVDYEGEKFPGKATKVSNYNKFFVSAMVISGMNHWKWPTDPDEIWYPLEDIKEKISPPIPINNRGIFSVPAIEKYRSFLMS